MGLRVWWASRLLRSSNPVKRCAAVERLSRSRHDNQTMSLIAGALSDQDMAVSTQASAAFERVEVNLAFQALLPMLSHRSETTRRLARETLRKVAPEALERHESEERVKNKEE